LRIATTQPSGLWSSLGASPDRRDQHEHIPQTASYTSTSQYQAAARAWPSTQGYQTGQHLSPPITPDVSNTSDVYSPFNQSPDGERVHRIDPNFGVEISGGARHIGEEEHVWHSAVSDACQMAGPYFPVHGVDPLVQRQHINNEWSSSGANIFATQQVTFAHASQLNQDSYECISSRPNFVSSSSLGL
jgi:hypothetical protein